MCVQCTTGFCGVIAVSFTLGNTQRYLWDWEIGFCCTFYAHSFENHFCARFSLLLQRMAPISRSGWPDIRDFMACRPDHKTSGDDRRLSHGTDAGNVTNKRKNWRALRLKSCHPFYTWRRIQVLRHFRSRIPKCKRFCKNEFQRHLDAELFFPHSFTVHIIKT